MIISEQTCDAWPNSATRAQYSRTNYDDWVTPAGGGIVTQLTFDPDYDEGPDWSPDGNQIAFWSNRAGSGDVWVMPSGGGPPTQVTFDPSEDSRPTWSPDGNLIAFHSTRSGNEDIWVIPPPAPVALGQESWGSIKGRFHE